MYEGVETTIQDYRHLHLPRKIHERNLVINILRFYDVFMCVVPFQRGADTDSLRGGVDVGGIGFEPRSLVNTPPIAMGFHGMETHGNPHIDSYHGFPWVSRYPW